MKIHNNTDFSLRDIQGLSRLGETVNNWRERRITLLQHPTKEDWVVSVGLTFDGLTTVIAEEAKTDWATALEYAKRGKIYISE